MPAEPDFLTLTRAGYDRTAAAYAERFHHHLDHKPVDLAVLSAFAGLVRQGDTPCVLDVGCGTGVSTALLAGAGLEVEGIDLSPNMVSEARRLNQGLSLRVEQLDQSLRCHQPE